MIGLVEYVPLVSYRLWFMTTLTLVGIGRVDGVEVAPQANFSRAHLCDSGADRSMCANVRVEYRLPWPHPEPEKLSTVLVILPGRVPLVPHRSADDGLGGCRQCSQRVCFWRSLSVRSRAWLGSGGHFRCLVRCLLIWHSDMCWYPSELYLPPLAPKLFECLNSLGQNVLPGRVLGVPNGLDSGLVVSEYSGAPVWRDAYWRCVEYYLYCKHEPSELCRVHRGGPGCTHILNSLRPGPVGVVYALQQPRRRGRQCHFCRYRRIAFLARWHRAP
jgi:hypothetical protein